MNTLRDQLTEVCAGQFLRPVIYYGRFFEVETDHGTEWVDQDVVGRTLDPGRMALQPYIEGSTIYSYRVYDGWGAYTSAPGYMDRTDLTVFETESEAYEYLIDWYSE